MYHGGMAQAWINNRFEEESAAGVSIRDTGLLHGAGVFTTMQAIGGRVVRLAQHLQRLRESCDALYIPLTWSDEVLTAAADELLARNQL
jgi:branched-chain amino acid aminotransferase